VLALVGAAFACAALAGPAMAHQFNSNVASGEPRAAGRAVEGVEEPQKFTFRPFRLSCERARSNRLSKETTFPSPTLFLEVKYSKCKTFVGKFKTVELPGAKTKFLTPVSFQYHANGYVEIGGAAEGEIGNAGEVEIEIGAPFKCRIKVAPQTLPSKAIKHSEEEFTAATFEKEEAKTENLRKFPSGIQDKLLIHNQLGRIKYSFEPLEGGICEVLELPEEGKTGAYSGTLDAEVKNANLLRE